jgi:ABC-2 type transport system permease protein
MGLFLSSLRKELRRVLREPASLALWLGVPFSIVLILHLAFGGARGGGPKIEGLLLIADQDGTLVSGLVAGTFRQGPMADLFRTEKVEEADGRRRMAKGEASGLIIIPAGFDAAVRQNLPCKVVLVTNPAQRILPGIAQDVLSLESEAVHYLHLVGGEPLRSALSINRAPTEVETARISVSINRLIGSLAKYLDPLLLDVEIRGAPKTQGPMFNVTLLFFPGMFLMTLLFLSRSYAAELWQEAQTGVLRRIRASTCPMSTFLLAKMTAVVVVSTAVGALALAIGRWGLDVPVADAPAALAWIAASAAVLYLAMTNLQLLAATPHGGDIVTSLFLWPSAMLGGSFFPLPMMPASLAAIGRRTPTGWLVSKLSSILDGKAPGVELIWAFGALLVVCAVLFLLAQWSVSRKFLQG